MKTENTRVQRAEPGDIDAIHALLLGQFEEHEIQVAETSLKQAIAQALGDEALGIFLVAREGDEVIGIAALSFAWTLEHGGKSAWLDELYVRPEHRGRGVGRALLRRSLDEARRLGCGAVDLEVDQGHRQAERLYEREGFQRLPRSRWARRLGANGTTS